MGRSACYRPASLVLLQNLVPHAGKVFTEPLFVLTAAAALAIVAALRRTRQKRPLAIALAAVLILGALGTNFVADAILRSLAIETVTGNPDVIVVASGGVRLGVAPGLDVLDTETEFRVATAIAAWRQHPTARLVMAGTAYPESGRAARIVELMRDRAVCAGVPASAILLDSKSTTTREHADRLLEMHGINRRTRVGIATSYFHMRRTVRVFRRHFDTVITYPTRPMAMPRKIADFIPHADALDRATMGVHEWIGIAWYAAQDARDDLFSAVRGSRGLQR